jgi:SAM-dependent methyltransferase
MKGKGLWLNLGCSDNLLKDFINVDIRRFSPEEARRYECFRWDLSNRWYWEDSSVDYILARDIIEHLPDRILTMNEAWRVLKPGGLIQIEVPTTDGRGAFQDPTHVSFWNRNSFFYFEDGNPHRERFGKDYGITARFKIKQERQEKISDEVVKLYISLEAVKNADQCNSPME